MTKYKALMSIVVIVVVAVATMTWSPQIADARWATQEGDSGKLPVSMSSTSIDVADMLGWTAVTKVFSPYPDHHDADLPLSRLETTSGSAITEGSEKDDISPTCRRICVKWHIRTIRVCDEAGNCTYEDVLVCCKWDLIDCYTG